MPLAIQVGAPGDRALGEASPHTTANYEQAGVAPIMQDVQLPTYVNAANRGGGGPNQDSLPLVARAPSPNGSLQNQQQQQRDMTPRERVYERHRRLNVIKFTVAVFIYSVGSLIALLRFFITIEANLGLLGLAVLCAVFWFFYETFNRPDWKKYKVYSGVVGAILFSSCVVIGTALLGTFIVDIPEEILYGLWMADAFVCIIASIVLIFLCVLRWKRLHNPNWRFGVPSRPRRRRNDDDYTRLEDMYDSIPPERN